MSLSSAEQQDAVAFLQRMVRAASLTGQEGRAAECAAAQMRSLGFDRVWVDEFGSVIGERRGMQPGPALLFDGHLDTVGVGDAQQWSQEPFGGALKDGRVYGRGASDTKGSLAGLICALGSLPRSQIRGTLYAVGSVGEEILEGSGLRPVLEALRPDGVVVGEPSGCRLAIGQKGRARLTFTARGRAAHSSTPENGESALLKAAEMVRRVDALPVAESPWLGRAVMSPVQIRSMPEGPAMAVIPYECRVEYDRRLVADETETGLLEEYRAALGGIAGWDAVLDTVEYTTYTGRTVRLADFHPAWLMDEKSPWVQCACAALWNADIDPRVYAVPYCTNGSSSAGEMNIPTLIFGPSGIGLAHVVDEYIRVDEYLRGVEGYRALALSLPDAFRS